MSDSGWSLNSFSDMLGEQSKRRREQDQIETDLMVSGINETIDRVVALPDAELLDYYAFVLPKCWSYLNTPRKQIAVWRLLRRHCRNAILARMQ